MTRFNIYFHCRKREKKSGGYRSRAEAVGHDGDQLGEGRKGGPPWRGKTIRPEEEVGKKKE